MAKILKDVVVIVSRVVKACGESHTRVYTLPESGIVTRPAPFGKPGRIVDVGRSVVWTIGSSVEQVAERYRADGHEVRQAA
jgi:hypothetical protein